MKNPNLGAAIVELYKKAATALPEDVLAALARAEKGETGVAKSILGQVVKNASLASAQSVPICQDTGTPAFYVSCNDSWKRAEIKKAIIRATRAATASVPLRPNSVDILTGKNSGDNTGEEFPIVYFEDSSSPDLTISLNLKGGGSENVGKTYSLPDERLNADRNLEGIRKCALDFVHSAQGKGCPPGILSICAGGAKDRISFLAKKNLLSPLGQRNSNPEIAALEERILSEANSLGIGPMGLGGKTALLDVKITFTSRHPASYFVEMCYSCWALRRHSISISKKGAIREL